MNKFYFETRDGDDIFVTAEALELAGPQAARDIAVALLPEAVIKSQTSNDFRRVAVQVRNEHGLLILTATLTLEVEWSDESGSGV